MVPEGSLGCLGALLGGSWGALGASWQLPSRVWSTNKNKDARVPRLLHNECSLGMGVGVQVMEMLGVEMEHCKSKQLTPCLRSGWAGGYVR